MLKLFAAVAVGGAVGAAARYGASVLWPDTDGRFPWTTFAVNILGSFILGLVLAGWGHEVMIRAFVGTGILGGFTTFSTFSWQAEQLLRNDRAGIAVGYLAGSVLSGLLAAWLGLHAGKLLTA